MSENTRHLVDVSAQDLARLKEWLQRPNGSHPVNPRLTVEAVEGGGILVRTERFSLVEASQRQGRGR